MRIGRLLPRNWVVIHARHLLGSLSASSLRVGALKSLAIGLATGVQALVCTRRFYDHDRR